MAAARLDGDPSELQCRQRQKTLQMQLLEGMFTDQSVSSSR